MGESVDIRLDRIASGLHWLGHYAESELLHLCARLAREQGIETPEDLLAFVDKLAAEKPKVGGGYGDGLEQ